MIILLGSFTDCVIDRLGARYLGKQWCVHEDREDRQKEYRLAGREKGR